MKSHVDLVDASIRELQRELVALAAPGDWEELFKIIHRPGWTSVAEFAFATGLISAARAQIRVVTELRQALLAGSRQVAVGEEARK